MNAVLRSRLILPTIHTNTTGDTIYALSTASGRAAIAVIRISGPACLKIYQGLCPGKPLPRPRTAILRRLHKPKDASSGPVVLDSSALVLYFSSPHTATGEDVLELHVHGGNAIVRAVLEAIPECGRSSSTSIRYAEPGEFTRRAFYNERLDLTQVEALGDILVSETEQQRRLAVSGSESSLGARYEDWRKMLLYARGELEALIDFSEDQHFDESPATFMTSISGQILKLKHQLELHITNASKGELLRNGINLALLGAPNAGKSSLLNCIAGRDAAIVSSEAGTTRDIVDVGVDIGGWYCKLGDTAGLRNAFSSSTTVTPGSIIGEIEREGIRRAKARALDSDVIVAVLSIETGDRPNSGPFLHIEPEVASAIEQCKENGKMIIVAVNKIDLLASSSNPANPGTRDDILTQLSKLNSPSIQPSPLSTLLTSIPPSRIVPISCHQASSSIPSSSSSDPGNIQHLLQSLLETFTDLTTPSTDAVIDISIGNKTDDSSITIAPPYSSIDPFTYWSHSLSVSHRQATNLRQCLYHLNDYLEVARIDDSTSEPDIETDIDIVASAEHLRHAANCLAKITGRTSGGNDGSGSGAGDVEDVLGVVFEKFCVGK
ncbi:putative mitochondrial gtpase [Phaeomoniella chlamydospora]|uniref:Putative mitochondrial gtpase n=1 Tax=Phaeomoniella chlamydospora TaxID=158046 RepID=A0A0G2EID3_PHACM|nr:putative mitochondrial gtpase [Phaeomoniella chlamydospora]